MLNKIIFYINLLLFFMLPLLLFGLFQGSDSIEIDHLRLKQFSDHLTNHQLLLTYPFSNRTRRSWSRTKQRKESKFDFVWPSKKVSVVEGDIILGGLMMVHERQDGDQVCGPIMPQGGVQSLEAMLYTLDFINDQSENFIPGVKIGAHILDDCDKDTYGLEQAVDFIKGKVVL